MPSHKYSSSSKRTPHRMSQHTFSQYPDDQVLHYYRWTSPPGVMKIMCIIIIIMCVTLFVCVASTLAWDYESNAMGLGGLGMGLGGMGYGTGAGYGAGYGGGYGAGMYGGGGIGGGSYGYSGYGGYYMDPLTGKGFIIGISAFTFIAVLVIFILVVSRQNAAKSTKFYLASIIISAILALLMLIASIVYLVAVNPMAQSSGSMMYNMIYQLCAQYQNQQGTQTSALFINQYLYHYCVVEPQEAIAIVLGFLVVIGLIILMVFAIKTRSQMNRYGRYRVYWEPRYLNDSFSPGVEKWVTNVSGEPDGLVSDYNNQVGSSRHYLDQSPDVDKPIYLPGGSDTTSTTIVLKNKARDYDTGAESADELDNLDYDSELPPILNDNERQDYKRQFERDHLEYKRLQAELDHINQGLAEVDRGLNKLQEGSPQFLDAMEVYTKLKSLKRSADYQMKKRRCKQLKNKLCLIKRRLSDYDRRP